jgi:hypothetical protein
VTPQTRRQRYEARHPDWTREYRRAKAARQTLARRLLREAHPVEYRALMDPEVPVGQARCREAHKALKARYPDEWTACLEWARKEQTDGRS